MTDTSAPVRAKRNPPDLGGHPLVLRRGLLRRVVPRWHAGDRSVLRVEARPGQGKSVFGAQVLDHLGIPSCWYRLDGEDRDAAALAAGLSGALRASVPGFRIRGAGRNGGDPSAAAGRIARELCRVAPPGFAVVLDDLHRAAEGAGAVAFLRALVEAVGRRGPRFLLISRRRAPDALATAAPSLRVTTRSLRLSVHEGAELCRAVLGGVAPRAALRRLEERCEGWVTGLLLHLGGLEGCPAPELEAALAPVPDRVLEELEAYFDAEVLPDLPREAAAALERLALLDDDGLPGALAETLDGGSGARQALRRLAREDLFVREPAGASETFVLHPLFRECLRTRARRSLPESRVGSLHAAAARWHEGRGDFARALVSAGGARDPDLVERLLGAGGEALVTANRLEPVRVATDALSEGELGARPHAAYLAGLTRFAAASPASLPLLERAAALFRGRGEPQGELKALTHALYYRLMIASEFGGAVADLERARELYAAAGADLEAPARVQAAHTLAVGEVFVAGRADAADRLSAEALEVAEASGEPGLAASALTARLILGILGSHVHRSGPDAERTWALLADPRVSAIHRTVLEGLLANHLLARRDARGFRRQADALWGRIGVAALDATMLGPLLRLWEAESLGQQGRWTEAEEAMRAGWALPVVPGTPHLRSLYLQLLAHALAAQGRGPEAVRAAAESRELRRDVGGPYHEAMNALYAGGAYAVAGEPERAEEALGEAVRGADRCGQPDLGAAARAHRALLRLAAGREAEGTADLRAAMAFLAGRPRALPYGWFPETLVGLLGAAVARGVEPGLAHRVAAEELGVSLRGDGGPRPVPRLCTLGGLEVAAGDRVIVRTHDLTDVQRQLLGRLAASPGLQAGQAGLQARLWPESPARRARSAFNTALSRLRRCLEDSAGGDVARDFLVLKNGILRLEEVALDAREFEDGVREGLRMAERGRPWAAALALRAALNLWRGDFLDGIPLDGEPEFRRLRLRTLYLQGVRVFVRLLRERGDEDEAIETLERALCHHPVDPDLSAALHDLWAGRDRPDRAAEVLDRFQRALEEAGYSEDDRHASLERFVDARA